VETFGVLKEWCGDQHLAVGCCRQTKKHPRQWWVPEEIDRHLQMDDSHAGMAWHKGRCHKEPAVEKRQQRKQTKDCVVLGALKGQTFKER
jgi:hypothetical protein